MPINENEVRISNSKYYNIGNWVLEEYDGKVALLKNEELITSDIKEIQQLQKLLNTAYPL